MARTFVRAEPLQSRLLINRVVKLITPVLRALYLATDSLEIYEEGCLVLQIVYSMKGL